MLITRGTLARIPGSPAAFCHFLMDASGVQSCRVQSEGVKNESKGLEETGLLARGTHALKSTELRKPAGLAH